MDTLAAGESQPAFTVRFRDAFQNLTNVDGAQVNFSNIEGTTQATIRLRYTALGVSTATVTRFPQTGNYTLTPSAFGSPLGLTVTGTTTFTVVGEPMKTVTVQGLADTLRAGDSLTTFTVTMRNRAGDLVTHTFTPTTARLITTGATVNLTAANPSLGLYQLSTTAQLTTAGTYRLVIAGIPDSAVVGNKRVVVRGIIASTATFTLSTTPMTATGGNVTLTVSYRDRFNNLTDAIAPIQFDNREFDTTGVFDLVRQSVGVYKATKTFLTPGTYTLAVMPVTDPVTTQTVTPELRGRNEFGLEPGPATRAEFDGVLASMVSGTNQAAFTVALFDRNGLPTDYIRGGNVVRFAGAATGTIAGAFLSPGNVSSYNIFTAQPTPFTTVGSYTLSITGVPAAQYTGTRTFAVTPAPSITIQQRSTIDFGGLPLNETLVQAVSVVVQVLNQVTITPPEGFEVSVNGGATTPTFYDKTITVTPSASGVFTLTVRFKPTSVKAYTGTVVIQNGAVRQDLTVSGRGVARTTSTGAVQIIDGKYFVDNRLFFPIGWSQASGIRPTFASQTPPPVSDGVTFTRNVTTLIPGLNLIEHESNNDLMALGYLMAHRATLLATGQSLDTRLAAFNISNNLDSVLKYIRIYLDSLVPANVKIILPVPRHFGAENQVIIRTPNRQNLSIERRQEIATVERFVRGLADHPKMFGWWSVGEPEERFRQVAHDKFFARGADPANPQNPFDASIPFTYGYTKPATLAALRDLMRNECRAEVNGRGNAWFRTQADLEETYTRLKAAAPNQSFLYMIGTHGVENIESYLIAPETYGAGAASFDDLQDENYLVYSAPLPAEAFYYENRATVRKAAWVDAVFRRDPENFDRRWYLFDVRPQPSFFINNTRPNTASARRHYLQFHPTGTGVATIKLYAGDLSDRSTPACLSCLGEGISRAATLAEQMYILFSKMYWLQEQDAPRVVNYGGVVFYSYTCASDAVQTLTNSIIRLVGDYRLGEVLQQPKIQPSAFATVQTGAGQESSVKTIVRQHNGFYYVMLINTRDSESGMMPAGKDAQRAQAFVMNPVTLLVPPTSVVTSCEELVPGSTTPTAVPMNSIVHPTLGARQSVSVLSAAAPLAPAAVRLFRFRIAHPAATVQTTLFALKAQTTPSTAEESGNNELAAKDAAISESLTPQTLRLMASPNPTDDHATVHLSLAMSECVTLTVRDVHGRIVAVPLKNMRVEAGNHTVPVDTRTIPSGVYTLTVHTSTERRTTRLLVVH